MLYQEKPSTENASSPQNIARPASDYTDDELAQIYSGARVDYIVPMPMNGKRMRQYINAYDVDLDQSVVAINPDDNEPCGVCMLGVRGDRTWITRLGIIPERRRRRSGQFLMDEMIKNSQALGARQIQLEVIVGNEPAHRLFTKLGFEETRRLHIIRRAPKALNAADMPPVTIQPLSDERAFELLGSREPGAAWTEETASLRNIGGIDGLSVTLPSGEIGWVIYKRSVLQLAHFVLQPDVSPEMMHALVTAVHHTHPLLDTKIENIPDQHPTWAAFEALDYHIAFSRIEMVLTL